MTSLLLWGWGKSADDLSFLSPAGPHAGVCVCVLQGPGSPSVPSLGAQPFLQSRLLTDSLPRNPWFFLDIPLVTFPPSSTCSCVIWCPVLWLYPVLSPHPPTPSQLYLWGLAGSVITVTWRGVRSFFLHRGMCRHRPGPPLQRQPGEETGQGSSFLFGQGRWETESMSLVMTWLNYSPQQSQACLLCKCAKEEVDQASDFPVMIKRLRPSPSPALLFCF